jgi:hypothetical protein
MDVIDFVPPALLQARAITGNNDVPKRHRRTTPPKPIAAKQPGD